MWLAAQEMNWLLDLESGKMHHMHCLMACMIGDVCSSDMLNDAK